MSKLNWSYKSTIKHSLEAKKAGLKLLDIGRDENHRLYKFIKCGHIQEIDLRKVRAQKGFVCRACDEEFLKAEAKEIGLIYIGNHKNKGYKKYKFQSCGHSLIERSTNIRKNLQNSKSKRCNECLSIRLNKEAKSAGLELLGPGRSFYFREYKFKACGHIQQITTNNVARKVFECQTCNKQSRHNKPSEIYLLKLKHKDFMWLKLGYSNNINSRIVDYGLPKNTSINILITKDFELGKEAYKHERKIHKKLFKKRLSPSLLKKYHVSGYNECYPVEMEKELLKEIKCISH